MLLMIHAFVRVHVRVHFSGTLKHNLVCFNAQRHFSAIKLIEFVFHNVHKIRLLSIWVELVRRAVLINYYKILRIGLVFLIVQVFHIYMEKTVSQSARNQFSLIARIVFVLYNVRVLILGKKILLYV